MCIIDWIFKFCLHFHSFGLKVLRHHILNCNHLKWLVSDSSTQILHHEPWIFPSCGSYTHRFRSQPNNHHHSQRWISNCEITMQIKYCKKYWVMADLLTLHCSGEALIIFRLVHMVRIIIIEFNWSKFYCIFDEASLGFPKINRICLLLKKTLILY